MLNFLFNKPEYYFQPIPILKKYVAGSVARNVDLSGLVLSTFEGDAMQRALHKTGVYDLALTEVIWQLAQPGALHVDVGANIGYISRIMQLKAGATGHTASLEPNPEVLPLLKKNRLVTPYHVNWKIFQMAAGETQGELWLKQPAAYATNHGTAHITTSEQPHTISVPVTTLDILFAKQNIALLKIDVEGFEWNVLQGAKDLIKAGQVENIVFEDFDPWPGQVPVFLKTMGYHIYAIRKGWRKVRLFVPEDAPPVSSWEEPNYLATKMGKPGLDKKFGNGYTCLKKVKAATKF